MEVSRQGEYFTSESDRLPRTHMFTSQGYDRLLRADAAHLGIVRGESKGRQPKLLLRSYTGAYRHPPDDFPDCRAYGQKYRVVADGVFS